MLDIALEILYNVDSADSHKNRSTAMQIQSSELPSLAFVGSKYDADRFNAVVNCNYRKHKPDNGLWASPMRNDGVTEWENFFYDWEWRRTKASHNARQYVTVDDTARIFEIAEQSDRDYLDATYSWDWQKIAEDYDAVYVYGDGVWIMRDGMWELPSIVFFNTRCFTVQ